MQRAVVAVLVAGLIVAASLVVAVSLPRLDCPEGFRLVDTHLSRETAEDFTCEERSHSPPEGFVGTPGFRESEVSDRLWTKVAIAIAGFALGATLFVFARAESRRPSSFDPMAQE